MNDNQMTDEVVDDQKTTKKIPAITETTELEYAEYKYKEALSTMLKERTQESIDAFLVANKNLFQVKDAYRIGARLIEERDFQRTHTERSQNLQVL